MHLINTQQYNATRVNSVTVDTVNQTYIKKFMNNVYRGNNPIIMNYKHNGELNLYHS